jgi:hypothetical protein
MITATSLSRFPNMLRSLMLAEPNTDTHTQKTHQIAANANGMNTEAAVHSFTSRWIKNKK